jgi:A/G-specific adenine glycosylase
MVRLAKIRRNLLAWYANNKRDLPWRGTRDPYRILVSEIMLQQTRVAAAIPYYERFLARFPHVETLATAPESDVLAHWSGLGYYSRARNLRRAAQQITSLGGFPSSYEGIRVLAGVGEYTAAAVGSIAFGLPHVAVDGNVFRVMSRLTAEEDDLSRGTTRNRLRERAAEALERSEPGDFNQALMELGATVCLPKAPLCLVCPISEHCEGFRQGQADRFPVNRKRRKAVEIDQMLLLIRRKSDILLWQRPPDADRMAGFWELPQADQLPEARQGREIGRFRHTITFHNFRFRVVESSVPRVPRGFVWMKQDELAQIPLSTIAKKALRLR